MVLALFEDVFITSDAAGPVLTDTRLSTPRMASDGTPRRRASSGGPFHRPRDGVHPGYRNSSCDGLGIRWQPLVPVTELQSLASEKIESYLKEYFYYNNMFVFLIHQSTGIFDTDAVESGGSALTLTFGGFGSSCAGADSFLHGCGHLNFQPPSDSG